LGMVATLEFSQHPFTKSGHITGTSSLTHDANATTPLRLLHATAAAATAA
jgi:hypothetical protein